MIKSIEIKTGNFHKGEDFNHPRMGMWSVKIDGHSWNAITAYGIHLVEQNELKFIPIPISQNWLKYFQFEVGTWSKIRLSDNTCLLLGMSVNKTFYIPIIEQTIEEGMSVHKASEIKKEHGDECGVVMKDNQIVLSPIKYVHELQNLYFEFARKKLTPEQCSTLV